MNSFSGAFFGQYKCYRKKTGGTWYMTIDYGGGMQSSLEIWSRVKPTQIDEIEEYELAMPCDPRYATVRHLIETGHIKTFREIFDTLPTSVVAGDLKINDNRFTEMMEHVERFTLEDLFTLAILIGMDNMAILQMVIRQWEGDNPIR